MTSSLKAFDFKTSMVGDNSTVKDHYAELQNILAAKNGYVYIYCSNESPTNVYFDNLQVVHTRGGLLEETHYYPFGLTMAGISSSAAGTLKNKYKVGGKELQSNEFSDNSGLEVYDFSARNYDPQVGRFWGTDKKADKLVQWSPYAYCLNNPLVFVDPDGSFLGLFGQEVLFLPVRLLMGYLEAMEGAHQQQLMEQPHQERGLISHLTLRLNS